MHLTPQELWIQIETHQEHVENDPKMRDNAEEGCDRGRQDEEIDLGSDRPEQ